MNNLYRLTRYPLVLAKINAEVILIILSIIDF